MDFHSMWHVLAELGEGIVWLVSARWWATLIVAAVFVGAGVWAWIYL